MPKVKILLEKGEDILEADESLRKALNSHVNGDVHLRESFEDPAMIDASNRFEDIHSKQYKLMVEEIIAALEEEYNDGDF